MGYSLSLRFKIKSGSVWYYIAKPNPTENYKPGVASVENYDTFDYRAYANIYPDLKKAYGYDAAKLYAYYVNFGKAEGQVGTFISDDNPKTNVPINGIISGTNELKSGVDINSYAVVPATLLDYEPPKKTSQLDNWRLNQRASCSDTTILLHCYDYMRGKSTFATPPTDPGTPGNPPAKTVGGFSDVTEKDYFAQPVVWAVEKKIINGTETGSFPPLRPAPEARLRPSSTGFSPSDGDPPRPGWGGDI